MRAKRIMGARGPDGRWMVSVQLVTGAYRIGHGDTLEEAMEAVGMEYENGK